METIIVIEKRRKSRLINLKELIDYKDLLYFLVVRGVKARYAQSVLGVGWAVIQPLSTMVVFTVVFGRLAGIESDGAPYALFSMSGLVAWNFFSGALSDTSNSLVANAGMLGKVYFPRLILPLAGLLTKFLDFAISLVVLAVLMVAYRFMPSQQVVYFPLLIILMFTASLGPGLIAAAWSVQYRDIKYAMTFIIQVLMYTAPVVYPMSIVPEKYRLFYALNPLVGVVEGFRSSILGTTAMPWQAIGLSYLVSVLLLLYALYSFSKLERTFADVA